MQWMRRLFVVFLVLVLVAAAFGVFVVRRSFPQTSGEIVISGLTDRVQVVRDVDGVPHIYASNAHDLYVAQGYVMAQDRFWQMDFFRHIGAGRLSEMFGDSQVETDVFLRSLDLEALARQELEMMEPEVREVLNWYAAGVNAYLAEHDRSQVSLEYAVLSLTNSDYSIEPWHPVHTLTWAKMMSWDLSGNLEEEIDRSLISRDVATEQLEKLYPDFPAEHPVVVEDRAANSTSNSGTRSIPEEAIPALVAAQQSAKTVWDVTGGGFEGIGSNNWVVGGSLTESGKPLLANDPHLGIRMPSIWYQIGLHCTGAETDCVPDVAGFTFAGSPGVIVGHNDRIAWGVTTQAVDTQDLYIEKINPDNPDQYEVDGRWVDMEIRTDTIKVAGGDDVVVRHRSTRHGPIISETLLDEDGFDGTVSELTEPYVVALAWQSLEPATLAQAILGINHATNYDEFLSAVSLWDIAAQNLVYADVEGNIAYQSTGEIPLRAPDHDGRYPVPGWTNEYEWTGIVPFEEMPGLFNPPQDFIASANQPILRPDGGPFAGYDNAKGYRGARIVEMITDRSDHTVEGTQIMQMDARDGGAVHLLPFIIDCVDCVKSYTGFQDMVEMLENWVFKFEGDEGVETEDAYQAAGDSQGAAVYQAIWKHLLSGTFHDELAEDFWPEGGSRWFEVVRNLMETPDDPWWDDVNTNSVETRDDIIEQAVINAHTELVALLGPNEDNWTWGKLHTAAFENETLGQSGIPPIEWLFNRFAPERVGGSQSIVNATGWDPFDGYVVDWIPSFRMVVDLNDLSASTAIHSTGNSGHAFHRHYDDMITDWTDGIQNPMRWTNEQVTLGEEDTLTLVPIGG